MKTRCLFRWLLLYGFCGSIVCSAQVSSEMSETKLAERLAALGCQVELTIVDGKVRVDDVSVSGPVKGGKMEPISNEIFQCLKQLSRLRKLRLDVTGGEVDRSRLRAIAALQSLQELKLSGRELNDEIMPYVCSLTNLESLHMSGVTVSEKGLAHLPGLNSLQRLDLSSFKDINRLGIQAITKLPKLTYLRLCTPLEKGVLSDLRAIPRPFTLSIGGEGLFQPLAESLAELKDVSSIRKIEFYRVELDASAAECLRALKNCHYLSLTCSSVTPEALTTLQSLNLHEIECHLMSAEVVGGLTVPLSEGIWKFWR